MLKVCEIFPQIGSINNYMNLPLGERALYDQYAIDLLEKEANTPVFKFGK